jgi:serine/threonine protein kinase
MLSLNIPNNISKEKKLSLLVIVLLDIIFGINNRIYNNIIDFLIYNNIIDSDINSVEYTDARNKLYDFLNIFNSSNQIEYNIKNNNNSYTNNFVELNVIDSGSFGNVYKVQHKLDNNCYAIKKIFITNDLLSNDIFQEVKIFSKLFHTNIVRYYSSWIDIDSQSIINYNEELDESDDKLDNLLPILFIQMELCEYTLKDYIENKIINDNIEVRLTYFKDILYGLKYLHNNNIIHRDIKPSNIFFINNVIKLGDFGLSTNFSNINYDDDIGFSYYRAPEIDLYISNNNIKYDYKIDIFSCGIILIEMLLDCKTVNEKHKIINNMIKKRTLLNLITDKFNNLILNMINPDKNKRYEINEILEYITI